MAFVVLVLLVAFFSLPSANFHAFSGIPFDGLPEYFGFLALLLIIVWRSLREHWRAMLRHWSTRQMTWILALLCVGLLTKGALLNSGSYEGFIACYRSMDESPKTGQCEKSYTNAFRQIDATRIDRRLEFGPEDWNLSFVNDLKFNYYPWVQGSIPRERIPFSAHWRGILDYDEAQDLELTYIGDAQVWIGSKRMAFGASYTEPRTVRLQLPPGRHSLIIAYAFNDGARVGMSTDPGPLPSFHLRTRTPTGTAPLQAAAVPITWRVSGWFVDVIAVGGMLLLVAFYRRIVANQWPVLVATGVAACLVYIQSTDSQFMPLDTAFLLSLGVPVFTILGRQRHAARLVAAYWSVALIVLLHEVISTVPLGSVIVRRGGSDYLAYESFARSILDTWSLQGGEAVFYYQPLFRYIRFFEHLFLGDGDVLIAAFARTLLIASVLCMVWRFRTPSRFNTAVSLSVLVLLLVLVNNVSVVNLMRAGFSEYPTWILFPLCFSMLVHHYGKRSALSSAMLGLSLITRFNQAPGLIWMFLTRMYTAFRLKERRFAYAAATLAIVCLVPVGHNLWYGRQLIFTISNAAINYNLVLRPVDYLNATNDEALRERVVHQLDRIFYGPYSNARPARQGGELRAVFRGLQLLWGIAFITTLLSGYLWLTNQRSTGRRGLDFRRLPDTVYHLLIVLLPGVFLAPHLFYQAGDFYPRHIVIAYLAMAAVALHASGLAHADLTDVSTNTRDQPLTESS